MPRIRSIKPEFFKSETIDNLSLSAQRTFIGLWCYCDDEGRGKDDARLVKAEVWPLSETHPPKKVERDLAEIEEAGLIIRYEVDEVRYLQVKNWSEHQKVSHPRASIFPSVPDGYVKPPEDVRKSPGRKGKEGKGTGNRFRDEEFEKFWKAYPARRGVKSGKKQAAAEWAKLDPDQQERAHRAVANYRRVCDNGDTLAKDAERFLRHEVFEDWLDVVATSDAPRPEYQSYIAPKPISCRHGTPQCEPCRLNAIRRAKELAAGIGQSA